MNHRSFSWFRLILLGWLSFRAIGVAVAQTPATQRKPNIIWIMADDMGIGDAGCYGQKLIQTPNIDKLATEGLKFSSAYAGAPVCAPSRCALMTGMHTGHAVIRGNSKQSIGINDLTVAESLKTFGYTTALVGKWGLGGEGQPGVPTHKGFDYFYGYIDQTMAHNSYPTFLVENETRVPLRNIVPNPGQYNQGVASVKVDFSNDLMQDKALKFIDANKDRAFYLYFSPTLPHANNEAHDTEVPDSGIYEKMDWPVTEKHYAAAVTRLDSYVGSIVERVHANGLDNSTIIFFTSDNGVQEEGNNKAAFFNSSGPFRGIKREVYEGGIREPMIARWTGTITPGMTSDVPWAFWDFFPTAVELAGGSAPANIDGLSIAPLLVGKPLTKTHEFFYWEFHEGGFKQAIRMGNWKAVKLGIDAPIELYDLQADIGETKNIAAANPAVVAQIQPLFTSARIDSPAWPVR